MVTRPSWRERFFAERRLTSKLKHLVLRDYVREFAYHLGTIRGTVYYIDGFAGPGVYRSPSGPEEKGSPLLIAELAEQIRTSRTPFNLRCLNVDKVPTSHRRLESETAAFRPHVVEHNYCGQFTDVLPDILGRIGNAPAFFFIDPFGTKDIPYEALRPVFNRRTRTEVLITFHTDGIAKKAGHFDSLDSTDARKTRLARALTSNLSAALALSIEELGSRWNYYVNQRHGGTEAFEMNILDHYRALLRGSTTQFRFTKAFPIHYRATGWSGHVGPVCFYLVFATQSDRGLEEMNNVMVRAWERFQKTQQPEALFPEFQQELQRHNIELLGEEIVRRFANETFTIDSLKHRLMQDSTLLLRTADYRKAVFWLRDAGRVRPLVSGRILNTSRLRVCRSSEAGARPSARARK